MTVRVLLTIYLYSIVIVFMIHDQLRGYSLLCSFINVLQGTHSNPSNKRR